MKGDLDESLKLVQPVSKSSFTYMFCDSAPQAYVGLDSGYDSPDRQQYRL